MSQVRLLGVPYDSGTRGARMGAGPEHLLAGGIAERLREAGHAATTELVEAPEGFAAEVATGFALLRALARRVVAASDAGAFPLVLAGNCATAVATVAGVGAADLAVVWLDAHGDLETPETTTSGFLDGMGLAMLCGRCWSSLAASVPGFAPVPGAHVVLVGARDLSDAERALVAELGITWVRADALRADPTAALAPVLDRLAGQGVRRAYVHVDLDVHDPAQAPVNGFQPPGGLTPADVRTVVGLVAGRLPLAAAALTAYDPVHDPDGRTRAVALALAPVLAGGAATGAR